MKTIAFDPSGPPLFANIRSGFANPGAYTLTLWEKSSNTKAQPDREGNFIDTDDDTHPLGTSAPENDGRIVESYVTVSPPPGSTQYFVALRVLQGDAPLDEVTASGDADQPAVTLRLFARLTAG